MISIPSSEEKIRADQWLKDHKSQYEYCDNAANACAEHFGLFEEDLNFEWKPALFTPIWMRELAKEIYGENK